MSIVKFASFSHNERSTCKPYFPHEKPFSFMGITKNIKLLSYYKTRRIFSRITSAGSGEPQPKLITFPKSNHIRNDSTIYESVEAPTLELQYEKAEMENEPTKDVANGIGIAKFIEGKSFFVTGATGFLSKVFVEKMLRTTPDIRKIYLLIRAEDKDDAMKRLKNEILDVELFKPLKEIHGNSFEEFMMSKFIPVSGDVCEQNLGLDSDIADEIANEIDVIVNSAAITAFDERYDMALEANTRGPSRLISFAKKCKKLKVLLHFSTAFANRDKNGVVYEETLSLGSSLTNGKVMKGNEPKTLSIMDIEAEMELAFRSRESLEAQNVVSMLKELGLKRASHYGWPNTYPFTKAMGEMLMNDQRGEREREDGSSGGDTSGGCTSIVPAWNMERYRSRRLSHHRFFQLRRRAPLHPPWQQVIAYSQKTWKLESGEPMHAESGYWRFKPDGTIEVVIAQSTGLLELQKGTYDANEKVLKLQSELVANASKVREITRVFKMVGDELTYEVEMATNLTSKQPHLKASFKKL